MILGIDEVGRGPWAGPLVVGAVVLGGLAIEGLTDSKKLSRRRREELDVIIRERAAGFGLGWVSAPELDAIGMTAALALATRRAVEEVKTSYSEIIIDGTINFLKDTSKGRYVTTLPKADLLVPSVSAASIIAKVARDQYMYEQDLLYPNYGFKNHVGYGTAAHRQAIDQYGITPLHRLSFAPLAKYRADQAADVKTIGSNRSAMDTVSSPTTKQIGNRAEARVAEYLSTQGYRIIDRNWRTRYCEIDIIAQRDDTLYFVEVKYRKNSQHGDGFAAITPTKLKQMNFAAQLYASRLKSLPNLRLAVASLSDDMDMVDWLELT